MLSRHAGSTLNRLRAVTYAVPARGHRWVPIKRDWENYWPGSHFWKRMPDRTAMMDSFRQEMDDFRRQMDKMGPRFGHHMHRGATVDEHAPEVKYDKHEFSVKVDVQHFTPDEVEVKVLDNQLIISAKHEQKEDEHGFVSRQFTREFAIPPVRLVMERGVEGSHIKINKKDVDLESIESSLAEDGLLKISGAVKRKEGSARKINIVRETQKQGESGGEGDTSAQ